MSRDAVLAGARRRFAAEGYEKATLRAIAADANVDPSMVIYLFGSKADLFRESLRLLVDPQELAAAIAGEDDDEPDVGTRMVRAYLRIWSSPESGATMITALHSATTNSDAHEAFRAFMQSYVLTAVAGVIGGGQEAQVRALLAAGQLIGVAVLRYVMRIEPMASLPDDALVRLLAPTITRYLTADAAELGLGVGCDMPWRT